MNFCIFQCHLTQVKEDYTIKTLWHEMIAHLPTQTPPRKAAMRDHGRAAPKRPTQAVRSPRVHLHKSCRQMKLPLHSRQEEAVVAQQPGRSARLRKSEGLPFVACAVANEGKNLAHNLHQAFSSKANVTNTRNMNTTGKHERQTCMHLNCHRKQ